MPKNSLPATNIVTSMSAPVQAYVASVIGQIDAVANDEEALWAIAARGQQMEMAGRLIAGRAHKELRTRVRNLGDELRVRGIERRAFEQSINLYDAFDALPKVEQVQALANLGFTKSRELTRWSADERLALAKGGQVRGVTLEMALEMPSREFEKASKPEREAQLEARISQQQTQIERLENEKKQLARDRSRVHAEEDLPPFAFEARQEVVALTGSMVLDVENLQTVIDTQVLGEVKHPEAAKWQPVIAGTAYHAIAGVHARLDVLMKRLRANFDHLGVSESKLDHALSPAEVRLAIERREHLFAAHKAAAKTRADDRANNTPGKPGRKRGQ